MRYLMILISLLIGSESWAAFGLNPFGPEFKPQENTLAQITNMPRVRTQDSIGLCGAMVAATIIDEANCVYKKVENCAAVPDKDKTSPLDMSRYFQGPANGKDDTDPFNYEGLLMGGSPALAIYQSGIRARTTIRESCAPFDQVVAGVKDPQQARDLELAMWKKFENSFNNIKREEKKCAQCAIEMATATAKDIKENYKIKASNEEILRAFAEGTYEKFLDKLLVPEECWDPKQMIGLRGKWNFNIYPEKDAGKSNYEKTIAKIKEVLGKKRPLSFSYCAQEPLKAKTIDACQGPSSNPADLGGGHALVIKGYRRVCNSKNQCYDAVQVHNSWGESWQNSNDDGWVDARALLDRSFYEPGRLTWLEPKQ